MRTTNQISRIRHLLAATVVTLSVLTAACGSDSDADSSGSGTGPGPTGTTGFEVTNLSDRDAYYLYTRACGAADWGEDELGSSNILYPGEAVRVDESGGCYDVLAMTKHETPRYQALYSGKTVTAGQVTSLSIEAGHWTDITDPVIASLSLGRK